MTSRVLLDHFRLGSERFEELSDLQRVVIESATAALEALDAEAGMPPLMPFDTVKEAWEAADMVDKRALLRGAIGELGILVEPAARQGDHTPILERLEFDWVSEQKAAEA